MTFVFLNLYKETIKDIILLKKGGKVSYGIGGISNETS